METGMIRLWPNEYIQRIELCKTFVDKDQTFTQQAQIK